MSGDRVGYAGDPQAVVVVVTATEASEPGWLRVGTCGDDAETSNVNYGDGAAVPNLAVVEPDANGRICVTTLASTHVVVDLFGIFDGGSGVEANRAVRWIDTRERGAKVAAGSEIRFDTTVGGFGRSDGVVINVTAVNTEAPGFITVVSVRRRAADHVDAQHTSPVSWSPTPRSRRPTPTRPSASTR